MLRKAKWQNGVRGWRRKEDGPAPGTHRHRGPMIRRWIGEARRRAERRRRDEVGQSADVIALTWAQTFGRHSQPVRETVHGAELAASRTILLFPPQLRRA